MLRTLLVVAGTLAFAAPAEACSIVAKPDRERLAEADVAVYTEVVGVRQVVDGEQPWQDRWEARLRVRRVYKGPLRRSFRIRYHTDSASCGLGTIKEGQRLAFLLHDPGPPYQASIASRLMTLARLHEAADGRFKRPT